MTTSPDTTAEIVLEPSGPEIRSLLADAQRDLSEARDATAADERAVEAALRQVALDNDQDARAELQRARTRLAQSIEAQTIAEAGVRALEHGLEVALRADGRTVSAKWRAIAAAQREAVAADRDTTATLLESFVEALDDEERRLAERSAEIARLGREAGSEGVTFAVAPARALSADYRSFRNARELLVYLAALRRP